MSNTCYYKRPSTQCWVISLHRRIVQAMRAFIRCNTGYLYHNRIVASFGAFVMLAPYTVKVVRAVLRGGKGREALTHPACDTKAHVLLLNNYRMWKIQSWCGVTCSRTGGALPATAGFQALGKSTPMSGTSACALGNDWYGQRK